MRVNEGIKPQQQQFLLLIHHFDLKYCMSMPSITLVNSLRVYPLLSAHAHQLPAIAIVSTGLLLLQLVIHYHFKCLLLGANNISDQYQFKLLTH